MSAKNILTTGATTGGIGLIATVLTSKLSSVLIPLIGSIVVVEGVEMVQPLIKMVSLKLEQV